jgi:hypothetical protein
MHHLTPIALLVFFFDIHEKLVATGIVLLHDGEDLHFPGLHFLEEFRRRRTSTVPGRGEPRRPSQRRQAHQTTEKYEDAHGSTPRG